MESRRNGPQLSSRHDDDDDDDDGRWITIRLKSRPLADRSMHVGRLV